MRHDHEDVRGGSAARAGRTTPEGHARWRRHHLRRLGVSAGAGAAAGLGAALLPVGGWLIDVLVGVTVGLLVSSLWVMRLIFTLDSEGTAEHFRGVDGSRREVELLSLAAAVLALVGVGVLLTEGQDRTASVVVGTAAVVAGWLTVHTTYTLSYAKHWVAEEPGCIDFPDDAARGPSDGAAGDAGPVRTPPLSEFGYTAFSVGMTYQISDTTLKSPAIRRLVFRHSLVAFVFGTVVLASALNVVIGLASGGGG